MTWDQARAVRGTTCRLIRLDPTGAPLTGGTNVYVTTGFVEFNAAPNYKIGADVEVENADGGLCFSDKLPDLLKRQDLTIKFCYPDPTRDAFMVGGTVVTGGGDPLQGGYNFPAVNVDPNPNGISIEVWQRAKTAGGAPAATNPYYRYLAPRTFWRYDPINVDANPLISSFAGYGTENPNWGTGPEADYLGGSGASFGYRRTASNPTATA